MAPETEADVEETSVPSGSNAVMNDETNRSTDDGHWFGSELGICFSALILLLMSWYDVLIRSFY